MTKDTQLAALKQAVEDAENIERCATIQLNAAKARHDKATQAHDAAQQILKEALSLQKVRELEIQRNIHNLAKRRNLGELIEQGRELVREMNKLVRLARNKARAAELELNLAEPALAYAKDDLQKAGETLRLARSRLDNYQSNIAQLQDIPAEVWDIAANEAGITSDLICEVKIVKDDRDFYHVYYGGKGAPDGKDHGHLTIDRDLRMSHLREPDSDRTIDNYANDPALIDHMQSIGETKGWGITQHTTVDGQPYTYALGWGKLSSRYIVVKGIVETDKLRSWANRKIYRVGHGPLSACRINL